MTQKPEDKLEILKIALEEGRQGLSDQDNTVGSIRQRSVWIGGLAGLIATFLGREAIKVTPSSNVICTLDSFSVWLGFIALIVTIASIINILRPRGEFRFHNSPKSIIDQYINGPNATDLAETYKSIAGFLQENYNTNQKIIDRLFMWLLVAAVAMFIEFIAWLIVVA